MSAFSSQSDIVVAASLELDRSSWKAELAGAKSDLEKFASESKDAGLKLGITFDYAQVRTALDRLQADVLSMGPLRIPVQFQPMGGGGGDWRSALAEVAAGYGGGGVGAAGMVREGYRDFLAARIAKNPVATGPYAMLMGGMSQQAEGYLGRQMAGWESLSEGAVFQSEEAAYARYAQMAGLVEGGAAASGGGGAVNQKFVRGMMGRMVMMELARLPIAQLEGQIQSRHKLFSANLSGSASQSFAAEMGVLESDSSGLVGMMSSPFQAMYGYDPKGLLASLQQAQGSTALMDLRQQLQQQGRQSQFGIDIANATGDTGEQARLRREAAYNNAIGAAGKAHKEAIDQANLVGKREAYEQQFGEAIGKAHVSGGYGAYGFTDTKAVAAARANFNAQIAGLDRAKADIDAAYHTAIEEAGAQRTAGETQDATREAILNIRNRGSISAAGLSGREATAGISGSPAERLALYNEKLSDQVKLLREVAQETEKVNKAEADRLRGLADAQEKANPALVAARDFEMRSAAGMGAMQLSAMGVDARVARFNLSGNTLAATLMRNNNQVQNVLKPHFAEMLRNGQMTQDEYVQALSGADQSLSIQNAEATKQDTLKWARLTDEVHELGLVSPYARSRQRIIDEAAMGRFADSAHASIFNQREQTAMGSLEYSHNLSVSGLHEMAAAERTSRFNPQLANVMRFGSRLTSDLAQHKGDPAYQAGIRDLSEAELENMLPHTFNQQARQEIIGQIQNLKFADALFGRNPAGKGTNTEDEDRKADKAIQDLIVFLKGIFGNAQPLYPAGS